MARPKKNNADYFSHDNNMRNDSKILALRRKYGPTGYAVWCMLLEKLTESEGFIQNINDLNLELLAGDFGIDSELLNEIIYYLEKLSLIYFGDYQDRMESYIGCHSLSKRLQPVIDKRNRERDKVLNKKRDSGGKFTTEGEQETTSHGVSVTEKPQSKVKESKEKNTYILYTTDINFVRSVHKELQQEGKEGISRYVGEWLKIMFNYGFRLKQDKKEVENIQKRFEQTMIKYIGRGQNGELPYTEMDLVMDKLKNWLDNGNSTGNFKNSIINFLKNNKK